MASDSVRARDEEAAGRRELSKVSSSRRVPPSLAVAHVLRPCAGISGARDRSPSLRGTLPEEIAMMLCADCMGSVLGGLEGASAVAAIACCACVSLRSFVLTLLEVEPRLQSYARIVLNEWSRHQWPCRI